MHGVTLNWISSYLSDRQQYVKIGDVCSDKLSSDFGVPQGSVLGPMLCVLFISPVAQVVEKFGLRHHQYADDTQIYVSFKPTDSLQCLSVMEQTTHAVRNWFTMNGFLLNPDKTEAMFLGTSRNLSKIKDQTVVNISGSDIKPSDHIKSLGVTIDAKINFDQHVSKHL